MSILGRGAFVGVGKETTRGTAVSRTHYFRAHSVGLQSRDVNTGTPAMVQASASFMRRAHFVARHEAGGPFRVQFGYEGCGILLTMFMGDDPTTGSPSGGIYPHTWLLGTDLNAYTVAAARGTGVGGATAQQELFEGFQVSRATLGIEAGGLMYMEIDGIAEKGAGPSSLDTPTFPAELPVLHHQGGTLTFNSATYKVRSLRVIVDRKLERTYLLGSDECGLATPSDHTDVIVEADIYVENEVLLTAQLAGTQGDLTTSFTGSGSRALAITAQNAYLDNVGNTVDRVGARYQTVRFLCESDGSDEGLAIVLSNTQATAEAA